MNDISLVGLLALENNIPQTIVDGGWMWWSVVRHGVKLKYMFTRLYTYVCVRTQCQTLHLFFSGIFDYAIFGVSKNKPYVCSYIYSMTISRTNKKNNIIAQFTLKLEGHTL